MVGDRWWTAVRLSHAIHEIGKRLIILCLGLKVPTVNSTGELATLGGCVAGVTALIDDLLSVGVVLHVANIGVSGAFGTNSGQPLNCHIATPRC